MKTLFNTMFASLLLFGMLSFNACQKDGCTDPAATNYDEKADNDDGSCVFDQEEEPSAPCDAGVEFCLDYGGTNKSGDATLSEINSSRYRVYWTTGSGNSYEQVELDIYGTSTGTYTIDTTYAAGTVGFEYFSTANGANSGVSGTLEVTEFDFGGNGVSGTFTVTMADGTEVKSGGLNKVQ